MLAKPLKNSSKVSSFCDDEKQSLARNLKPLLIWMKLLGVDLRSDEQQGKRSHVITVTIFIWALLWFANDLYGFISSYLAFHLSEWGSALANSTTTSTAHSVNYINYTLNTIGVHLGLIILAYAHWPKLWKILGLMETHLDFDIKFHRGHRRLCISIIIYLFIMTSLWVVFLAPMITIQFENPLERHLSHISAILRWFYISNWSSLFVALCHIASGGLQSVRDDITRRGSLCQVPVPVLLRRWKHQITLVRRYVDQLNVSFGLILLTFVPYAFVGFTTHIFYLCGGYHRGVSWKQHVMVSSFAFKFISDICAICFAAENICKQARNINISLYELEIPPEYDQQVNKLVMHLHQHAPTIHALEFFTFGKQLIQTLFGTTLTYLVIMFQFQSTE